MYIRQWSNEEKELYNIENVVETWLETEASEYFTAEQPFTLSWVT